MGSARAREAAAAAHGCCFPQPGGRGAERPPLLGRAVLTHRQGLQRRRGWRRGEGTLRLSGAEKSRSQAEPAGGSERGANRGPLQREEPPTAGAGVGGTRSPLPNAPAAPSIRMSLLEGEKPLSFLLLLPASTSHG